MMELYREQSPRAKVGIILLGISTLLFCMPFAVPFLLNGQMPVEKIAAIAFTIGISAELLTLLSVALIGKEGFIALKDRIASRFFTKNKLSDEQSSAKI